MSDCDINTVIDQFSHASVDGAAALSFADCGLKLDSEADGRRMKKSSHFLVRLKIQPPVPLKIVKWLKTRSPAATEMIFDALLSIRGESRPLSDSDLVPLMSASAN